ncbi:hypothetical protein HK405_014979, partial [Cladochytrium tenue]
VKRSIQTLKTTLRGILDTGTTSRSHCLPLLEFGFNSVRNESTSMSPFELDIGYIPREPASVATMRRPRSSRVPEVERFLDSLRENHALAMDRLQLAQGRQARPFNKLHRADPFFQVGDRVML